MTKALRILAASAEPTDRHVIEVVLLCRGHTVWTAPSIPQANAILLDFPGPVAVALLDLQWPDGPDGRVYGTELRNRFPDIRLVFLLQLWHDVGRSSGAADRVLVRPFTADALVAAVES